MHAGSVHFDNSYAALPERFYARLAPEPVVAPATIRVNRDLAAYLGFDPDWLASPEGAQVVAGNRLLEGSSPIATVYAGHQFGGFNPRLGDGRAILLGELLARDGRRYDLQLKGSGRTPFSRRGDGRSPLGPVLREYLLCEAMAALGIPTTRALAAAVTGERVRRERSRPGGVLVRVAQSHIRIGTFEYFASRNDVEALQLLVDHVIERHVPEARSAPNPAEALLQHVAERQARLVAQWQLVGFLHGVMNTDNVLVSGETIDYGPCAFLDAYDPDAVFSSIDHGGRYAYGNQPPIAQWNLSRLAQALLPLLGEDDRAVGRAQATIDRFPDLHASAHRDGMARKLGLPALEVDDQGLVEALLQTMQATGSDFTLTFRRLSHLVAPASPEEMAELGPLDEAFAPWLERWRQRRAGDPLSASERAESMRLANPVFIPRNHQVEAAIRDAEDRQHFCRFHRLVEVLRTPFAYDADAAEYSRPPRPEEQVRQTFCGT